MAKKRHKKDFDVLVSVIQQVHRHLTAQAGRAANISLTIRNWAIGYYIREYEQSGADRATYGETLLDDLATRLRNEDMKRVEARELRRYRQFYLVYPRIWESATPELRNMLPPGLLQLSGSIRESVPPESPIPGETLITRLSFTHLAELIAINDPLKRSFYEIECTRGNWSVRELKRQIGSLYYERWALEKQGEAGQHGSNRRGTGPLGTDNPRSLYL